MKKLLVLQGLFLALIGLIGFSSCDSLTNNRKNNQTLESYVQEKQKTYPSESEGGFTAVGIEIKGDYVVLTMTYDEHDSMLEVFEEEYSKNRKELNKEYIDSLVEEGKSDFIKLCRKEHKGIKIIGKGEQSGKTITMVDIKPGELPAL